MQVLKIELIGFTNRNFYQDWWNTTTIGNIFNNNTQILDERTVLEEMEYPST